MARLIHFVDVARLGAELRPMCGAWSDDVTWTTVVGVVTCSACGRLLRRGRATADARRHEGGASEQALVGDGTSSSR